jgi:predicted peptidase
MRSCAVFLAVLLMVAVAGNAHGGPRTQRISGKMEHQAVPTGFLNKTMVVDGKPRHYVLYVPREYKPDHQWPLVVFLHGMGERGSDGLAQSEVGIGRAIRLHPDRFPCLVAMPQCPDKTTWVKAVEDIDTCLHDTRKDYSVDDDRIYLTGLSMGGFAAWQYGAEKIKTFAAIMPICGGGKTSDAEKLARVPIWAFHGADDTTVKPEKSREMVEAVKKAGGDVKYTEYAATGHNSWDKAYEEKDAIKWLLSQRKK